VRYYLGCVPHGRSGCGGFHRFSNTQTPIIMIKQTEINNGFLLAASEFAKEELKTPSDTPLTLTEAITVWAGLNVEDFTYWDNSSEEHQSIAEHNGWKHDDGDAVHINSEDQFSTDILHTALHLDDIAHGDAYYLRELAIFRILHHMENKAKKP